MGLIWGVGCMAGGGIRLHKDPQAKKYTPRAFGRQLGTGTSADAVSLTCYPHITGPAISELSKSV